MHSNLIRRAAALTLAVLLAALAGPAPADENAAREALKSEAAGLLERGDLAAYDQRASELRRSRQRTPGGLWQLYLFYKGVDHLPMSEPQSPLWARIESATADYLRGHGDSPSAVIAAARVLVAHAWAYRSSDIAANLSSEQLDGFAQYLHRAAVLLDEHRAAGSQDPDWYALRVQIMNGEGDDRQAILALAQEGLGLEPTYEALLYVASQAMLPKWGGSAALHQRFVALALEKSAAQEGTQAYARIMFNIADRDGDPIGSLDRVGAQWPRLKASLEEISAAYPDAWNLNAERAMACLVGNQADLDAATRRVLRQRAFSVAWFDSLTIWPQCELRQQRARGAVGAVALHSLETLTVSTPLLLAVTAAIVVALLLLSWLRRSRAAAVAPDEAAGFAVEPGGSGFPRNYPMSAAFRAAQVFGASMLCLLGLAGVWAFGIGLELHDTPPGLVLTFLSALLATGAVLLAIDAFCSTLVLRADALEIRELWRVRRVSRADIASRQLLQRGSSRQLLLRLKDSGRMVKFPLAFRTDAQFDDWFRPIPDADALAAQALEAEVAGDSRLGDTPDQRLARLAQARQWAKYAAFTGPGLFVWAMFYPHPYPLLIAALAALPWIVAAVMAAGRGIFQLSGSRGPTARPDLSPALFVPAVLLALRAFSDVHTLDLSRLLPWAAGAGVLLACVLYRFVRGGTGRAASLASLVVICAPYGYGTASLANTLLDRSAPSMNPTRVLRKYISSGRYRSYWLTLARWENRPEGGDERVPLAMYQSTQVGETVCVALHRGALAVRWYDVTQCPVP